MTLPLKSVFGYALRKPSLDLTESAMDCSRVDASGAIPPRARGPGWVVSCRFMAFIVGTSIEFLANDGQLETRREGGWSMTMLKQPACLQNLDSLLYTKSSRLAGDGTVTAQGKGGVRKAVWRRRIRSNSRFSILTG